MPASIYALLPEEREDEERKQLLKVVPGTDECTEVKIITRNCLATFRLKEDTHIWDIDYAVRQEYEKSLHGNNDSNPIVIQPHRIEFDWIKRHLVCRRCDRRRKSMKKQN